MGKSCFDRPWVQAQNNEEDLKCANKCHICDKNYEPSDVSVK